MTRFYHSPLFTKIREYFENSSKDSTLFLFVPYIKTKVLTKLLENLPNKIVIITTWEPRDIQLGSSELELYLFCKERNISLFISQNMHLKIYSIDLQSAILATGNISNRGLLPDGNYESATLLENLDTDDRMFLEKIQNEAHLVDEQMYEKFKEWSDNNKIELPKQVSLEDIIPKPKKDHFLISALPMTRSVDTLVLGYLEISSGQELDTNDETALCISHDLTNYGISLGLSEERFRQELAIKFFEHPFIQKIDGFILPEAYFGRIKEWIQNNCTTIPVPSRRELTGNVQVLLEWFVSLGNGKYAVDVPGAHSQRIKKLR